MSKAHDVQTRGVVISRYSSGEGSVRVNIFTEQLGLIGALAKSAREERSKLRPHLTVGTFGHFDLVQGANTWRVVGAVGTQNYYFAFKSAEKQRAAARVLSLLRQLINGEERDEALFAVVWDFLSALSRVQDEHVVRAERLVVLQILAALGYVSKEAVPAPQETFDYSVRAFQELEPLEKEMRTAIKNGFVASGLL